MYSDVQKLLAGRYAEAVLNVLQKPCSLSECTALAAAVAHYTTRPSLLFFLQMPLYTWHEKLRALELVRTRYALPTVIRTLDSLLLDHHRIALLPLVYTTLIAQSHARAGRVPCTVTSSSTLTPAQQQTLYTSITTMVQKTPLITWQTDATLIAGMTIQTKELRWEDAIDTQLRRLTHSLLI